MYTRKIFPFKDMIKWTRMDIYRFVVIATIPVLLYSVFDLKWLHLPWLPIALIGTAVAFLIGFKNSASYDRLWEARKIWGGIVNTSRSWGIMVNEFINNEHATQKLSDEELNSIRRNLIYRHFAWMTAHRYALRQSRQWETFFTRKTNQEYQAWFEVQEHRVPFEEAVAPYLSDSDKKYIESKTNKATQLLSLQSKQLKELKEKGLVWEFSYLEMQKIVVEFFTLQGKSERIKNFPYPRQFATLNHFYVWIFIFLLPFGIMNEFDQIGNELMEYANQQTQGIRASYRLLAQNFVWFSIPFSVIISWVFHSMERIGEASENPFEGTANDIPITTLSRTIEIDLREMLDENPGQIPLPIQPQYDIQM